MMHFCTLFDSYYLYKGIALYLSLKKVSSNFHIYVMAFDKECYDKLMSLHFDSMTVEYVADFETPELLEVKPTRSKGEYCWTCGPSVIYHFLTKYYLDEVSYLDSDLFFLSDPKIIYDEVGKASVAITEQGLGERNAKTYGKYCVQYLTFKNSEESLEALTWWRDSCIEWCFQKLEGNRYADQKYFDEFPKRWKGVYVIENLGAGIAPWNMYRYNYYNNSLKYQGREYPFVFFHMHGIKIEIEGKKLIVSSIHFPLNRDVVKCFFAPYAEQIKEVLVHCFGYNLISVEVRDMSFLKKIEYRLRNILRHNNLVRWLYFDILMRKDKGHGTKL